MREAGSKWMRMRPSLRCGSQTMLLLTVPSVIPSFGLPIENITAGIIKLDFAVIKSMQTLHGLLNQNMSVHFGMCTLKGINSF